MMAENEEIFIRKKKKKKSTTASQYDDMDGVRLKSIIFIYAMKLL